MPDHPPLPSPDHGDAAPNGNAPSAAAPSASAPNVAAPAGAFGGAHGSALGSVPSRRAADRGTPEARGPRPDRALHLLLLAAERESRVGVTVTAGGVTVSGRLVSTKTFARTLADQFTNAMGMTEMDPSLADALRALVDDAMDVAHGDRRAAPDAAAYEHATAFINLAEARVVSGAGMLPAGRHGVLWRCRVCDVEGWALGDLAGG